MDALSSKMERPSMPSDSSAPIAITIRREAAADADAIRSLTARAFAGLAYSDGTEPLVIDALRGANALVVSLVAILDGHVVGHVAFSPALSPATGWCALGPISVEPSLQRRGIGARLIDAGLRMLRERGAHGCVLVGDHRYYRRFGFVATPDLAPPAQPAEHFQILPFGESVPVAPFAFHPAFSIRP
jgi:putative acetyltransferase